MIKLHVLNQIVTFFWWLLVLILFSSAKSTLIFVNRTTLMKPPFYKQYTDPVTSRFCFEIDFQTLHKFIIINLSLSWSENVQFLFHALKTNRHHQILYWNASLSFLFCCCFIGCWTLVFYSFSLQHIPYKFDFEHFVFFSIQTAILFLRALGTGEMFFKDLFGVITGSLVFVGLRGESLLVEGWGALEGDSELQTNKIDAREGLEEILFTALEMGS